MLLSLAVMPPKFATYFSKLNNMALFSNWHLMRILRAAIAIWAIFEYTRTHDWLMLAFGGFFAVQAIFDFGCCGASGCAAKPPSQQQKIPSQEIEYEEVK